MPGWFSRVFGSGDSDSGPGGASRGPSDPAPWWEGEFPEWALVLKRPDRFSLFMSTVDRYFSKRGIRIVIHPDGMVVMPPTAPLKGQFGLANLMQSCAQRETSDWNGLVAAHFDALARSQAQQQEFDDKLKRWEFAGARLRVRLWDTEDTPFPEAAVASEDIPGLTTALVVDLPEAIRTVSRDEAKAWGRGVAELFREARDNVMREVCPEVCPYDPQEPDGLLIVEADSFYTASVALDAESVPGLLGEHGVFLSMPVRNGLLAWRFNALADVQGIGPLVRATRLLFEEGPGSISSRVWWLRNGAWHEIGYESGPEHVAVIPPAALVEYLNGLAGES